MLRRECIGEKTSLQRILEELIKVDVRFSYRFYVSAMLLVAIYVHCVDQELIIDLNL